MVLAQMGSDLAFGKTATQSSTVLDAPAGRAVDKDTNGNLHDRSVTHTNSDANAWWQVDLGKPATVRAVKIWNRTDCCGDRLSDYWVFVSNTPFTPAEKPAMLRTRPSTWNSHQTTVPRPSTTIFTGGIQGQYVRVQLTGTGYLSLAEVEVKGADENVPAGPMAKSAAGEFRVVLGPKVWAPEAAQYRGQTHMIRWLSNETEFTIANNSAGPREVIVSASLATYPGPRHAYLVLNGTKLPEIQEVKNMFWIQGPQLVQFRARLKAGENRLSLRTDEPAGVLPGNRPVALALLEDLHVESPRTAGR
jgi:hypothetical protein